MPVMKLLEDMLNTYPIKNVISRFRRKKAIEEKPCIHEWFQIEILSEERAMAAQIKMKDVRWGHIYNQPTLAFIWSAYIEDAACARCETIERSASWYIRKVYYKHYEKVAERELRKGREKKTRAKLMDRGSI